MTAIVDNDYPDINNGFLMGSNPQIQNQNYIYSQMTSNANNSGYNPKNPYTISTPQSLTTNQVDLNTGNIIPQVTIPSTCGLWGY